MKKTEDLPIILQHLGSAISEIDAIVEDAPGSWKFFFVDGYSIKLNLSNDQNKIVLMAILGFPDSDSECEVLKTLLCYQLIWRGVYEPRIGLDAELGALICWCEFEADNLNNPDFEDYLLNFWLQSATLTEMVSEGIPLPLPAVVAEIYHLHA